MVIVVSLTQGCRLCCGVLCITGPDTQSRTTSSFFSQWIYACHFCNHYSSMCMSCPYIVPSSSLVSKATPPSQCIQRTDLLATDQMKFFTLLWKWTCSTSLISIHYLHWDHKSDVNVHIHQNWNTGLFCPINQTQIPFVYWAIFKYISLLSPVS